MTRLIKYLLALAVLALFALPAKAGGPDTADALKDQPRTLHYTDTLRSQRKQDQFMKAIELAPSVFVYKEIVWEDASTVTVKGMKFNASMKNTLMCEIVEGDPALAKRLKTVNAVTKPLNGVVDLTVSFHRVPAGIAVDYLIRNISVFGIGRSSDK